jgi:NADH-quinone oxidoreductase subunit L
MRNMGGLHAKMPVTFWVYLTGALALAGIAPLSGFFSKDEILVAASQYNLGIFVLLILAAFLTAFYMGRQVLLIFFGPTRTRAAGAASENRPVITVPLIILAVLSFFGGLLNFPGVDTLGKWLEHSIENIHPAGFSPLTALIALLVALVGILVAWQVYGRRPAGRYADAHAISLDPLQNRLPALFARLANAWGVDQAYQQIIVRGYQSLSAFLAGSFDQGLIDAIVNGFGTLSRSAAELMRRPQTGFVRSYALMVLFGVVAILTYLVFYIKLCNFG